MNWTNRIVGYTELPPEQLTAHPRNAHVHFPRQREAMRSLLGELGWIGPVIENVTTGHLLDGHLRVEEALSAGATRIPVLQVELSPDEEAEALVTFDGVGQLARWEAERLNDLVADIDTDHVAIDELLQDLADIGYTPPEPLTPPDPADHLSGDFRSICAVFPADRYADIVTALTRVPGDTVAEKLTWLLRDH